MSPLTPPSMTQRVRGVLRAAPTRIWLLVQPYDAAADEDALSGGEGASAVVMAELFCGFDRLTPPSALS